MSGIRLLLLLLLPAASAIVGLHKDLDAWCHQRQLWSLSDCAEELETWCLDKADKKPCLLIRDSKPTTATPTPREVRVDNESTEVIPPTPANDAMLLDLRIRLANRIHAQHRHQQDKALPPKLSRDPNATLDHSELSVNANLTLWNGDIRLSEEQAESLEESLLGGRRAKRKVSRLPYFLWSKLPIPYAFHPSFPPPSRDVVRHTLHLYHNNTCVRFQEEPEAKSRLEFRSGLGCSSFVGQMGGVQEISIQSPACALPGIVAHELGHALGLFHEQGRPDQGSFIGVDFGNIHSIHWANFLPQNPDFVDYRQQPYDLGSVMHYGPYGFALNDEKPAVFTRDPRYQATIGQRRVPTFIDYAQINSAYCSKMCPERRCEFGGYVDPNDCERCICPDGLGGPDCAVVRPTPCGGTLTAQSQPQTIQSPNYPHEVPLGTECVWMIQAPAGLNVSIQFIDDFSFYCKTVCDDHFVEVKRGSDFRSTGYRFCCSHRPELPISSQGPTLIVILRVDDVETFPSRGFRLRFWSQGPPTYTKATFTLPPLTTQATEEPDTTTDPVPTTSVFDVPSTTTETTTTSTTTLATTSMPTTTVPATEEPTTIPTEEPTTPTPTTLETTTRGGDGCECEAWSGWSGCSQRCGGCGHQSRRRHCHVHSKNCQNAQTRKCNFIVCRRDGPFMVGGGEFHLLWDGCCIGLVKTAGGLCGGLSNVFSNLLSSFMPHARLL